MAAVWSTVHAAMASVHGFAAEADTTRLARGAASVPVVQINGGPRGVGTTCHETLARECRSGRRLSRVGVAPLRPRVAQSPLTALRADAALDDPRPRGRTGVEQDQRDYAPALCEEG
jgi:hypothetical protein